MFGDESIGSVTIQVIFIYFQLDYYDESINISHILINFQVGLGQIRVQSRDSG